MGYLKTIQSFEFMFLLKIFAEIFPYSDVAFNVLQKKQMNIVSCKKEISFVHNEFKNIRKKFFDNLWTNLEKLKFEDNRIRFKEDKRNHYKKLFWEIMDCLIINIHYRFNDMEQLTFLKLLHVENF